MDWFLFLLVTLSFYVTLVYVGMYYAVAAYRWNRFSDGTLLNSKVAFRWRTYLVGWHMLAYGYVIVLLLFPVSEIIRNSTIFALMASLLFVIASAAWSLGDFHKDMGYIGLKSLHQKLFRPLSDEDLTEGLTWQVYKHSPAWKLFMIWTVDLLLGVAMGVIYPFAVTLIPGAWIIVFILIAAYFAYNAGKGIVAIIQRRMLAF